MFGIATVLLAVAIPAAAYIVGGVLFGGQLVLWGGSSGGVAGSANGGQTSTQAVPPGTTTPASGYTWAQLGHDYPGLRTPCDQQPNAAGKLQCYWSHYSNVNSAEPSAKELPEGTLRNDLLGDFDFYQNEYAEVEDCTATTLTTDVGCIAGAQTLDGRDTEIASVIQQGLSGQ
jgi:hypothetical protein